MPSGGDTLGVVAQEACRRPPSACGPCSPPALATGSQGCASAPPGAHTRPGHRVALLLREPLPGPPAPAPPLAPPPGPGSATPGGPHAGSSCGRRGRGWAPARRGCSPRLRLASGPQEDFRETAGCGQKWQELETCRGLGSASSPFAVAKRTSPAGGREDPPGARSPCQLCGVRGAVFPEPYGNGRGLPSCQRGGPWPRAQPRAPCAGRRPGSQLRVAPAEDTWHAGARAPPSPRPPARPAAWWRRRGVSCRGEGTVTWGTPAKPRLP